MVGRTVFHFRILEHIGGGGMGIIYKAQDLDLEHFVAIKYYQCNSFMILLQNKDLNLKRKPLLYCNITTFALSMRVAKRMTGRCIS